MRAQKRRVSARLVALSLVTVVACSSTTWGPLAVTPSTGDDARTEGVIRMTPECVLIDADGELTLLVWPADRTTWDSASREVSFRRGTGDVLTIGDGESVVLGGGWSSRAQDSEVDWISPPAASCVTPGRWYVSDVLP